MFINCYRVSYLILDLNFIFINCLFTVEDEIVVVAALEVVEGVVVLVVDVVDAVVLTGLGRQIQSTQEMSPHFSV
jgi:hypothetical protein